MTDDSVLARSLGSRAHAPVPPQEDLLPSVVQGLYDEVDSPIEVLDVFNAETYTFDVTELIQVLPRSPEFVLSIPHAGLFVPTRYVDRFDLSSDCLVEIDLFSDVIYEALGGWQVICWLAPFFIDMNRSRETSDTTQAPRHLHNPPHEYYTVHDEPILKKPYSPEEEQDVLRYYDLYHNLLAALLDQMRRDRGYALLIDGHSMTAVGQGRVYDEGEPRDNFVVGTLGDTSAHREIIEAFVGSLDKHSRPYGLGLSVAKDEPYSGGFITRRHNAPDNHVHVMQIEITMDTYMYEAVDERATKRFALKQPRVKIVRDILARAIDAACQAAERIYK